MATSTFLLGASGSGKTYCLRTLINAGKEIFILSTEPGIKSTLGDLPPEQCHWHYIPPATQSWDDLIDSAKKINTLSYEGIAKLSDMNKRKYTQFLDVLSVCNNFVDQRTGEEFGDVMEWGEDRVFIIDSLSGLNLMAMNLVVGSKPTKSMSDWMVSADNLERFIITLLTSLKCYFVLTAHIERETDEITGGVQIMASSLGRKLAPRLPRFFDDVILCRRDGTSWGWSTAALNVDLKTRNLPLSDKLPPDFVPLIKAHEAIGT